MKYKTKPIVVEAFQLTRRFADVAVEFIDKVFIDAYNLGEFSEDACYIDIKTFSGVMTANEGDYIIKGGNGEFYPCKPDIFKATYEPVEEQGR